jgi:hypothetical protein
MPAIEAIIIVSVPMTMFAMPAISIVVLTSKSSGSPG